MFSPTDNMEAEGDKLTVFLNSCLKQTKHVTEVKAKLDEEGIDYDTLYELSEEDLRSCLKDDLGIKNYRVGLIVNKFRDIDGSGVQEHPAGSGASGFVVLTEKHNNYLLKLQENTDTVKKNIDKLEIATQVVHKNTKTVSSEINTYYESLSNIMKDQQNITFKKLETVTNGKLSMIKNESVIANQALEHLEKSDEEFKRLLNDRKLDISKKHGAVTQHIDGSQQGLVKYGVYLDKNMSLPTETKIEYDAKETQVFKVFLQQVDNIIDADISFTKIEFVENEMIITWKSDVDKKPNAKFVLQFKELNVNINDDEKKEEYEWNILQPLKPKQTNVALDVDIKEEVKEEKKYEMKDEEKNSDGDEGRLGLLRGLTMYQFRILVTILRNKICSKALTVKTPQFKRLESSIITATEEMQLMQWIPNSARCKFKLLFRASRDGFGAAQFHNKCDYQGANITIFRSEQNHVFGGYTTQSWQKTGHAYDKDAWLYLLRSSKGDNPRIFKIVKNKQNAIRGHSGSGPRYGSDDIRIYTNCNNSTNSKANLRNVYEATTDNTQMAGSSGFKVIDYEVWQIQDPDQDKKIQSALINDVETNQLMKWIQNADNCSYRFRLSFNSKVDGFGGAAFHTKCNGIAPTITIAQSTTNHVFGGYTEQPWKSDNSYARDDNAWLYSLRNADGNTQQKFDIYQNPGSAIYNHSSYGPTFGSNHDLFVANSCNGNSTSSTNLGSCYKGKEDPYQLNGGTANFQVKDYEVWEVEVFDADSTRMESTILSQQEFGILNEWVKESGNSHYKLLLRGSVDGFAASTFHTKCDEKGKTLVIIRSETNYVFGGYTEVSWKHAGYKPDSSAWIYLLRNANGDQPEKWTPSKNKHAIYTNSGSGPTFGSGFDISLANGCNANTNSYSGLGTTYSADASQTKLAGAYNFKVTEYEVWRVC